jgi:hypothetical protein
MTIGKLSLLIIPGLAVIGLVPVLIRSGAHHQEKFLGKWHLDAGASQVQHEADTRNIEWRTYAADGGSVRVAWGRGPEQLGAYSARCDDSAETIGSGKIRCRQTDASTVDGEQLNDRDQVHRYYRRAVSPDGRQMTITWFTDAARTNTLDKFVYTKAQ